MHQLINEEDTNGPTLAVDLKARFTNQQMEEKHGEKSVQVYQKKIWDALDWQYHPLMLIMSMQLWKDVMEKVDFTVQQTKANPGQKCQILIQAEITTKKFSATRKTAIKYSRWIPICTIR